MEVFNAAARYWSEWGSELKQHAGPRDGALKRPALFVQLLSHARHHSPVAVLTTSLPERVAGDRNYDYRYAWIRDASLSLAFLAGMGGEREVSAYLKWLARLRSETEEPIQVCHRIDGDPRLKEEEIDSARGYKDSQPVRKGNRAARQPHLGSMGLFANSARIYLAQGGEWRDDFWKLLRRAPEFTCRHWKETDNGICELVEKAHYVSGTSRPARAGGALLLAVFGNGKRNRPDLRGPSPNSNVGEPGSAANAGHAKKSAE